VIFNADETSEEDMLAPNVLRQVGLGQSLIGHGGTTDVFAVEAWERMTFGGVGRLTDTAAVHEHSMWSDFWRVAWVVMGPVTYTYAAR
jgi:hypothetical protein